MFHASKGNILGSPRKGISPRIVQFVVGEYYYVNAIKDWIAAMASISYYQRRWDDIKTAFTGRTRSNSQLQSLKQQVQLANDNAESLADMLTVYQADETFNQMTYLGDPFPLLHKLDPDEQNLPLRVCVAEMAGGYCEHHPEDPYCDLIHDCKVNDMEPKICRPKVCPFQRHTGCIVTSTCMNPEVIAQYREALQTLMDEVVQEEEEERQSSQHRDQEVDLEG
eukprot:gene27143-33826_t